MSRPSKYSVYLLINPCDGRVFYVGCSAHVYRRIDQHLAGRDIRTKTDVGAIKSAGGQPVAAIVCLDKNKDFALREERRLIEAIPNLRNVMYNMERAA